MIINPIGRAFSVALVGLVFTASGAVSAAAADWPDKPVIMIVPWGAGGGTDATARMIATLLEKEIGKPVPVQNRTGGSGVVGHSAIANAAPDGYTIGVTTLEISSMHYQGLTKLDYKAYAPIGLYNADPAAIFVNVDGKYADVGALMAAIKGSKDRELKASGSAQGGVNHLAMAGMLKRSDIPVPRVAWVPSEGAAPGLQDLAAGGVDFAMASLPEGRALMDAGKVKPIAIFAAQRDPNLPDVPTFKEATGVDWAIGSWRGLTAPAGTPDSIVQQLQAAIAKVVEQPEYKSFMVKSGYEMQWTPGADFEAFMANSDQQIGETLKAVGLAK